MLNQNSTNLFEVTQRLIAQLEILNEVQSYIVGREAETKAYVQCVNNLKLEVEKIEHYLAVKYEEEVQETKEVKRKVKEKEEEESYAEKATLKEVAQWNKEMTEREVNLHYLVTTGFSEINKDKFGPLLDRVFKASALINEGREKVGIPPNKGLEQSLQEYAEQKVFELENEAKSWSDYIEGSDSDESPVVELERVIKEDVPIVVVAKAETETISEEPKQAVIKKVEEVISEPIEEMDSTPTEEVKPVPVAVENTTVEEFVTDVAEEVESNVEPVVDTTENDAAVEEVEVTEDVAEESTVEKEDAVTKVEIKKRDYSAHLGSNEQDLVGSNISEADLSLYSLNNDTEMESTDDVVDETEVEAAASKPVVVTGISLDDETPVIPLAVEEAAASDENTFTLLGKPKSAEEIAEIDAENELLNDSYDENDFEGADTDDDDNDFIEDDPEENPYAREYPPSPVDDETEDDEPQRNEPQKGNVVIGDDLMF